MKNTLVIVLTILVVILAGLSYYLYSAAKTCQEKALECKDTAEGLGANLQQCVAGIAQYQQLLTNLQLFGIYMYYQYR